MNTIPANPTLPRYFPIEKGIFEIAPGLRPLGTDFGNSDYDKKIFQIDQDFKTYHSNKLNCASEDLHKYFLTQNLKPDLEKHFIRFFCEQLVFEYPNIFSIQDFGLGGWNLKCTHTNHSLYFAPDGSLDSNKSFVPATHAIHALALQVQEDFALLQIDSEGKNYLSLLHVCSPAHWSPGDKIGKDFTQVHAPIPGIEKINSASKQFAEAMVKKGPFVRFVWGFATDNRLNHHPSPPPEISNSAWHGRKFVSPTESKFYLRIERQVTWGFPELNAALFTIRVSFWDGDEIKNDPSKCALLLSALKGMNASFLKYKGLHGSISPLVDWLQL